MKHFSVVDLATPAFIVLVVAEILVGRFTKARANYEARDTATSLGMGLVSTIAGIPLAGAVALVTHFAYVHRLATLPYVWWAVVAVFFAEDLAYYWFHRLSHERRLWWAAHVNHHSSQHYNLSTALRQTWTGELSLSWIVYLPLLSVGFPPAMIATQKGISLVYQFWVHTETIRKLPAPVEWLFNTPSHHRVHHARNPRYIDRNYAGILIIWDRLFGTFEPEHDDEPCRYGIVKNLGDFNLLRVAFHEWIAIGKDLASTANPIHWLGYVLGPPGWSPDGSRETSKKLRAQWRERERAAPRIAAE